ncbi:ATP-grasp domain-containing protein [Jeotgalibacillus salarius]|uniref:ATP-grasp domain-containing protein n=1 Tax=Jeotgalibacillus salarius TaxID=546023 RepID=A0A4Y8LIL5_9BACL|nr:ATP-grasp domain-containing protein [Jeotgalibacillus salarius]TFE01531.1 ATP-grasp domain-containing protein [Jeotgalibacillus salarius]
MLIVDNHIISPLLIQSALKHSIPIYYHNDQRDLVLPPQAKLLTNSESCLSILDKSNRTHAHTVSSKIVKNKAAFRKLISSVNPAYYFSLVTLENLLQMDKETVPYPVVIKPNKGYSSVGVYIVKQEEEWESAVISLQADLLLTKGVYADSVIDGEEIIIEQWIDGEEYAVDCYMNEHGKPVILNVLKRIFTSEHDTSDRIYFTSSMVIEEVKDQILSYLYGLNDQLQVKNYPFHIEVRLSQHGIIPIELNPLRFAGAGTTDLSHYAFGVNGAEAYFLDEEPQWETIMNQHDPFIYGFFCAEIPLQIKKELIQMIDHTRLKEEFSHILEYREINAANDRTFAVIFFKTESMTEIKRLLNIDLSQYIQLKPLKETIKL